MRKRKHSPNASKQYPIRRRSLGYNSGLTRRSTNTGVQPHHWPLCDFGRCGRTQLGRLLFDATAFHGERTKPKPESASDYFTCAGWWTFCDQVKWSAVSTESAEPPRGYARSGGCWIKTLVLEGRVITGDAMFCHRDLCKEIRDRGGHYFFVVKDNQPTLKESIAAEFRAAFPPANEQQRQSHIGVAETREKKRGRKEHRRLQTSTRLSDWPGLAQVRRIVRSTTRNGKESIKMDYAITCVPHDQALKTSPPFEMQSFQYSGSTEIETS